MGAVAPDVSYEDRTNIDAVLARPAGGRLAQLHARGPPISGAMSPPHIEAEPEREDTTTPILPLAVIQMINAR
jgi:hypothetical protein